MPLKGVRYRVITRKGKKVRLAFRGDTVVEAKPLAKPLAKPKRKARRGK